MDKKHCDIKNLTSYSVSDMIAQLLNQREFGKEQILVEIVKGLEIQWSIMTKNSEDNKNMNIAEEVYLLCPAH